MSITGSGSAAEPYVISSYTDLRRLADDYRTYSGVSGESHIFIELASDIDFNEYNEEWKTVELGNGYHGKAWDLNMNGHDIKNIEIPSGQWLFEACNPNGNENYSVIRNGGILNIFNNGSAGVIGKHPSGTTAQPYGLLDNIRLSVNVDKCGVGQNGCFDNVRLYNSSAYVKGGTISATTVAKAIFSYNCNNITMPDIKNCDFWIDIEKGYSGSCPFYTNLYSDTSAIGMTDCRFQGEIRNAYMELGTVQRLCENIVLEMYIPNLNTSTGARLFKRSSGFTSGVYNGEFIKKNGTLTKSTGFDGSNAAYTSEIRDAAWLGIHSFPVVTVRE